MNFFFVENLQVLFFIMCDEIRIEFIYIFGEIVVFVTQKMECKLILHEKSLANAYDQIFNLFCTCKLTKCLPNVELQIYLMINKLFISFDSLIMLIIYTYSTWFFPLSLSTHFVQIFFKNKKPQHWWIYKTSKWMIPHENNKNVKCWRSCELFFFWEGFCNGHKKHNTKLIWAQVWVQKMGFVPCSPTMQIFDVVHGYIWPKKIDWWLVTKLNFI